MLIDEFIDDTLSAGSDLNFNVNTNKPSNTKNGFYTIDILNNSDVIITGTFNVFTGK
jgi:hypothetical protein